MMKKQEDGGPAFSRLGPGHEGATYDWPGMTLRDYFAAKAMAAIELAWRSAFWAAEDDQAKAIDTDIINMPEGTADLAYGLADAMLKAREASSD